MTNAFLLESVGQKMSNVVDEHYNIVVFTDVEPDDVVAIWLLMAQIVRMFGVPVHVTLVVVENDLKARNCKAWILREMWPEAEIFIGPGSGRERTFPADIGQWAAPAFGFGESAPPVIINLAPPRLLLETLAERPTFFRDTRMFCYGGFNIREVQDHPEFPNLFAAFRRVYMAETRFALHGHASFPDVPNGHPMLGKLVEDWNKHIRRQREEEIRTLLKPEGGLVVLCEAQNRQLERAELIVRAIQKHPRQFVFADPLVVLAMGHYPSLLDPSIFKVQEGRYAANTEGELFFRDDMFGERGNVCMLRASSALSLHQLLAERLGFTVVATYDDGDPYLIMTGERTYCFSEKEGWTRVEEGRAGDA